jgi:hypothetical protein
VRAAVLRTAEAGVGWAIPKGERWPGALRRLGSVRRVRAVAVESARGDRAGEVVGLAGRMVARRVEMWALKRAMACISQMSLTGAQVPPAVGLRCA